jgi:hypothetical protein
LLIGYQDQPETGGLQTAQRLPYAREKFHLGRIETSVGDQRSVPVQKH